MTPDNNKELEEIVSWIDEQAGFEFHQLTRVDDIRDLIRSALTNYREQGVREERERIKEKLENTKIEMVAKS